MPEGDSVFRACRQLDEALAGATLVRAELRVPRLAERDLVGWQVTDVTPRGKHLLIHLAAPASEPVHREGLTLHSHLMMEGRWHTDVVGPGEAFGPWRAPAHQARIVLEAERPDGRRARAIAFEVQQVRLVRRAEEPALVGHLGPDLLDPDWDDEHAAEAIRRLREHPERAVGLALLDQRVIAGIGNIYRSELCFLTGVHPAAPVSACTDLPRLVDLAHRLLRVNRDRSVRVTTGGMMGPRADLWVYGRARQPCRRCRTPIRREEITDPAAPEQQERSIYVCPRCQATGAPTARSAPRPAGTPPLHSRPPRPRRA